MSAIEQRLDYELSRNPEDAPEDVQKLLDIKTALLIGLKYAMHIRDQYSEGGYFVMARITSIDAAQIEGQIKKINKMLGEEGENGKETTNPF